MSVRTSDVEEWQAKWLEMAKQCKAMADSWPEYVRLANMPSTDFDGFGAGGGDGRRSIGAHSDPVAALVLRCEGADDDGQRIAADEWRTPAQDRTREHVELLHAAAVAVANEMRRLAGLKRLIDNRGDGRYGRESSVKQCLCCEATVAGIGEDRIKAGYCPGCYKAWERYRREVPDAAHELFRRWRRAELDSSQRERAS